VAYVDEGVELRKAGITLPVMVMNPEVASFSMLAEYDLEPEIFSFSLLSSFEEFLLSSGLQFFPVHIKLDTGMHRLGFEEKDMDELCKRLVNNNSLKVRSVFSHLAASEDPAFDDFTARQAAVFEKCCEQLQQALPYSIFKHIANTSAVSRHPSLQFDMVRLGIGLYGIDDNPAVQKKLKNVSALSTTIAQVKNVRKGESVGYGCKTVLKSDAVIATVRIGYADGYPRSLGNGIGKMMINNIICPVVGNVCMDMTMLDVTGVACKEGDTVLVFGEELPLTLLASWANTIPYEIMTGVSQRVKRVYYEE
jgi:alanine racemase